MSSERARRSVERVRSLCAAPGLAAAARPPWLTPALGRDLLDSMLVARHVDLAALELRAQGRGHYTITSAGHEGNVVLGRQTRTTDPTVVHYRSAALVVERARQVPTTDIITDLLLSLQASRVEPTSGGRHKVFGGRALGIVPQTSTIASQLPRVVGLAFGLEHRRRLGLDPDATPPDALVCATFGDAAINHSTWLGAVNAVGWAVHRHLPFPLLLVCEDNGLGLSVRSPRDWVALRLGSLPHVKYFHAEAWDLVATWEATAQAIAWCRRERRPAVLHLSCARLLGHAGGDVDTVYRSARELAEAEARDPVYAFAETLLRTGVLTGPELATLEADAARRVADAAARTADCGPLTSREDVLATLVRPVPAALREPAPDDEARSGPALTLAQGLNAALGAALAQHPELIVFGEDVAKKGGVYGVTRGLADRFGPTRVFNTLLDEQHVLGLALGTALVGLLPVAEIQYLAFLHNAEDQLRGEAALLPFFSRGAYDNPLVVRIAGFADPRGTGGPFHNEASLAVLRDIPGLVVAVPARADDASALVAAALRLAHEARRTVVIVEPIALYHERDLFAPGDNGWLAPLAPHPAAWGQPRVYAPEATDLTLVTYGYGVRRCLRVARVLRDEHDVHARVLDLRWVAPLPTAAVLDHARETRNLLVVDETRRSGSVSEGLAAAVLDAGAPCGFARVTAADCPVPLGTAAALVLPSEAEVLAAALRLVAR